MAVGLFLAPWDKLAHVVWFAVLSALLRLGLGPRAVGGLSMFCVSVAVWDEWRQLMLPGRSAGLDDLMFDGLGIFMGLLIAVRLNPHFYSKA